MYIILPRERPHLCRQKHPANTGSASFCGNLPGRHGLRGPVWDRKGCAEDNRSKKLKDVCEKAAREWAAYFGFTSMFRHVYMQIFKAQHVGKADKTGFILHSIYIMYII